MKTSRNLWLALALAASSSLAMAAEKPASHGDAQLKPPADTRPGLKSKLNPKARPNQAGLPQAATTDPLDGGTVPKPVGPPPPPVQDPGKLPQP